MYNFWPFKFRRIYSQCNRSVHYISAKTSPMVLLTHFNILVAQEYRPWDLFFGIDNISIFTSSAVTNLERKELSGDLDLLRNSLYSCCEGANFGPTEAKCSLRMLDMRDESLETSLLFLKSLILILSLADFIMQNW